MMPIVTTIGRWGRRRARWIRGEPALLSPLVLAVLIGALAFATPREFAFSRLLPAAPALASSMWSVTATVVLGLITVVTVVALAVVLTDPAPLFTAAAISAVTAAAAYASHVRLQRERMLVEVRSVADAAQQVLLRPLPPRVGEVEVETMYLAAAAQARIGGDFYECVDTPFGVRLLIGDVRGKGLSAVGVASAVIGAFREAAHDEPDLARLARRLDTSVARYSASAPDRDSAERFATALLAEITDGSGCARLVNCGHPAPLLLRSGSVRALEPTAPSPPLNLAELVGGDYRIDLVAFTPGDHLLLFTDGVIEARDQDGCFFPLLGWLRRQPTPPRPRDLLDRLHRALLLHSGGGLNDDIAALAVRHIGARAADLPDIGALPPPS